MRVTITKPNVYNSYGIAMPVGSIQTVDSTFGASLVYALQATDTDSVLPPAANTPFSTTPTNTASAVAQALKKHPFMPAGVQNVQQLIPATLFMGTANQTAASSTVTITAVTQGSLYIGSQLSGPGITAGTAVTAILTGNGGVGTVTVNNTTGFVSTPLTAIGSAAPAVALSTTNPLAAGQQISPFLNSNGSVNLSFCSIMRGGNPVIAGTTNPNFNFVQFPTVSATAGGSGYVGGNSIQVGVMHMGLSIVLVLKVNAQTSGATITQVANTELTGNGNIGAPTGVGNCDVMIAADGIHRSSAGHLCMGLLLGAAYVAQLNA